jgi:DNA polymerase III subunit delta'
MAAKSAARSWPLIGHGASIERLRQMAARSRIPTALLFSGPQSTGRLATARELARTLLCPEACHGVACGECSSCRRVTSKNHPDLDFWSVARQEDGKQVSKSGVLTIETVREIAASATLRPYESERRVIIIDDAETLGEAAQQALLKTLEDAPEYLAIVLIATSVDAIIATVQSRVAELTFPLVATAEIAAGLRRLRPDVVGSDEIARLAQGKVGWALDAADKPELLIEEREASADIESWIAASRRDRLVKAYRSGDALVKKQISPQAVQENLDRATLVWRDLMLNANGAEELAFDPGRVARLDPTARLETRALYAALVACRQCQFDLSHNVRPRLALEIMVNQWPTLS